MGRGRAVELFIAITIALVSVVLLLLPHLNQRMEIRTVSVSASNKPTVVLDAGHGGFDGGAQCNGINEKELNLAITQNEQLLCMLFGFRVVMTRNDDLSLHEEDSVNKKRSDMHNRLAMMLADPYSITVSIHLNKFEQPSAMGAQVFYSPKSANSDILAQTVQDSFRLLLQPENKREIKKADRNLFLLYNNNITPAVIVECGFISNADEAAKLKTTKYQEQVAMTICYSLMKFQNRGEVSKCEIKSGE